MSVSSLGRHLNVQKPTPRKKQHPWSAKKPPLHPRTVRRRVMRPIRKTPIANIFREPSIKKLGRFIVENIPSVKMGRFMVTTRMY